MKKTLSTLALALAITLGADAPLAAENSCTGDYVRCLNDTAGLWTPLRLIADVVCFDDYTACVYWAMLRG